MRKGERYRKSVRGCIISRHISVLHLVIVKKGPAEIPGLTDESIPCARLYTSTPTFRLSLACGTRSRARLAARVRASRALPAFPKLPLALGAHL